MSDMFLSEWKSMNRKFLVIFVCGLMITGCTKAPQTQPDPSTYDAYVALSEAADSVSQSLTQLGATEQAAYPPQSVSPPPSPASYGMSMPTSINWNGPIEPLVQQIAHATNYKLNVLGKAPAIPIIVAIAAKDTPIGNILRDAGYQCHNRASIVVFPSAREIELRYATT